MVLQRLYDNIRLYLFGGDPDGRWTLYDDAGGAGYVNAIKRNGISVRKEPLRTLKELSVEEGRVKTDVSGSGPADKGGIIVLPTFGSTGDLCAAAENREAVVGAAEEWSRDELGTGYSCHRISIGTYFKGRYTARSGDHFDESSPSIELAGVTSEVLEAAASRSVDRIGVESVLVKDYNTGELYFVFRKASKKE